MKVKCVVLENGSQYDVSKLTPATFREVITDLAVVGNDPGAVLMKYKAVQKVK